MATNDRERLVAPCALMKRPTVPKERIRTFNRPRQTRVVMLRHHPNSLRQASSISTLFALTECLIQPPSSEPDEFAFYRFFMPPIAPCSFLFACDAFYEFQPPQAPHCTMLLLVRWIKLDCAPVLPEELDLGPFVLRKVPKERFALALVLAQSAPPLIFDE
ncbi:hypothetical protein CPB85DRAFT_1318066 [Mucidula mucida]|nr:hypothetical protein CPB85DRAFT_1318066 [Mucidula mucida]